MNHYKIIFLILIILLGQTNCTNKNKLDEKKQELQKLEQELQKIRSKIAAIEKEINTLSPNENSNKKAVLVTVLPLKSEKFEHFIEVNGSVVSRRNITISAENSGVIETIHVVEGDVVKENQRLLTMDTELFEKELETTKTEYELASTLYERQKKLWENNVGTELQYLEAKTRKETLENNIANIETMISKSLVVSPFSATIEKIYTREGEMAQPGNVLIRLVSLQDMYVEADVSEKYTGKIKKRDSTIIIFPETDKKISSRLRSVGKVIDKENRTFTVEADLPVNSSSYSLPNMMVILLLKDFEQDNSVVVPTYLIQQDSKGEFLFIVENINNEMRAKKTYVKRGITYKNKTLILSGLQGNELLVDEGARESINEKLVKIIEN